MVTRVEKHLPDRPIENGIRLFYTVCVKFDSDLCVAWTASAVLWRTVCAHAVFDEETDVWDAFDFGWGERTLKYHQRPNHPLLAAALRIGYKMHLRDYEDERDLTYYDLWTMPPDAIDRAERKILELIDFRVHIVSPHRALRELEERGGASGAASGAASGEEETRAAERLIVDSVAWRASEHILDTDPFCVAIAALLCVRQPGVVDRVAFVLHATTLAACVDWPEWPSRDRFVRDVTRAHDRMRVSVGPPSMHSSSLLPLLPLQHHPSPVSLTSRVSTPSLPPPLPLPPPIPSPCAGGQTKRPHRPPSPRTTAEQQPKKQPKKQQPSVSYDPVDCITTPPVSSRLRRRSC